MRVKKQQLELCMEQLTGSRLRKEYGRAVCCHRLSNLYAEHIMRNAGLDELQTGIQIGGSNINNLRYVDTTTLSHFSCVTSFQLCPALCDPMDYSLPGSSVHGILQARILEWVAMPSSKGPSPPRD